MRRSRRAIARFLYFTVILLALASCACASALTQSPDAAPVSADAENESFFSHFCGHFARSVGVDSAIDAASLILSDDPPDWWDRLKSAGALAGKSLPALLSGGLTWQGAAGLLSALWDVLPKENFKRLMRELLRCPRCRAFAWDYTLGMGERAWQNIKDGGSWIGEKSTTFWNWIWEDDESAPEPPAAEGPGFWASAWDRAAQLGRDAWQKTKDGGAYVGEKAGSALDWASEKASGLWRSLRESREPAPASSDGEEKPGFWASAWDKTAQLGRDAWQKTKDGGAYVGEKAGSVWDWTAEKAGRAWRWVWE